MTKQEQTGATEPKTLVVSDRENWKGVFKRIGGSQSDDWNHLIANQAMQALWENPGGATVKDKDRRAIVGALDGISPGDELEGMMAAQLIAAHNAAMRCYRRAMLEDRPLLRREHLDQANKLSRTWAALLGAFGKHRGKGRQKIMVEHVHVHAGGQAVVGNIERSQRGRG